MAPLIPLDKLITGAHAPLRSMQHIEALEAAPFHERIGARTTYEAICNGAALDPDKTAIYFLREGTAEEEPLQVSYRQMLGRIHQTANLLHDLGVGPRDAVTYMLPLVPQAYFVLFGGQAAGIVSAVNPMLEPSQIADILRAADTRVLVTLGPTPGAEIWEKAMAVRSELPNLKAVLQVMGPGDEQDGVYAYDALLDKYPADRLVSGRQIDPQDIASYFHTGGTTGAPKLAMHTHANQIYQAWAICMMFGVRPEHTFLAGLPMFHVTGAIGALYQFCSGMSVVQLSPAGFRNPSVVRNYWKIAERYRAGVVFGVPTILSALLGVPSEGVDLSSVVHTVTGASTVPVEVARAMQEKLGKPLLEIYGCTEATGLTHCSPRDGEVRLGSTGLRVPYSQHRTVVMDAEGTCQRDCAVDEIGVVLIQGDHVFPGYVQQQHNANLFVDGGWLNTGDLGRIDADGYLWITGRAKDTIIRGGHNIDPLVIEQALHQHPDVQLAAAVGQPDAYAGELPVAYVQVKPGASVQPAELLAFARERIPERAANPVHLEIISAIPVTLVGKIFKPQLRWNAAERVFTEVLAPLAEQGVQARVAVGADGTQGTLATVTLAGGAAREPVEAQVHEWLGPFGIPHRVEWA